MSNQKTIYLKDYQQPAYVINRTELSFELETTVSDSSDKPEVVTIVKSRLEILRNEKSESHDDAVRLAGQQLQ